MKPRALDLFSGAGGISFGLHLAGFEVTGVDIRDLAKHYRGGTFVQADAMTFPLEGYDLICASPPCQSYSALRHLVSKERREEYPDLIAAVRERLIASGIPYIIENVEGAPLAGNLTLLCGTMFGLQTPDGRAELRRHRLFETSWPICLKPACQHGQQWESLTVTGSGMGVGGKDRWAERRARDVLSIAGHDYSSPRARHEEREAKGVLTVTGHSAEGWKPGAGQRRGHGKDGSNRQTYSIDDARHAMGIDWMPMKYLSQAIPPAYAHWLGLQALDHLHHLKGEAP